jgi:hypothetical protein
MTSAPPDAVDNLAARLVDGCVKLGLDAEIIAPARVRVSAPGAHARLAETVCCMPDGQEELARWWSWGEPICAATQITDAARIIGHVVTPPLIESR